MSAKMFLFPVVVVTLAACSGGEGEFTSPGIGFKRQFESPEIAVSTSDGTVVCQLYTRDDSSWDRAVSRPAALTDDEANAICLEEGARRRTDRSG